MSNDNGFPVSPDRRRKMKAALGKVKSDADFAMTWVERRAPAVVKICTQYGQSGMWNIFILLSIAVFGLYQAIFIANAGGAWDNAKKLVEVGDTVGDPFKDTTSVALNPIIKFSTLFGLLAVEIALGIKESAHIRHGGDDGPYVGVMILAVGLVFVWRSFYAMRIPEKTRQRDSFDTGAQ